MQATYTENFSMNKSSRGSENRIREQYRGNLKEMLSAKGQKRWALLKDLALEHGYTLEDEYSYRYDKNYLMKIAWNIIYVENVTTQAYEEIRELLERKGKIKTSPLLIGNALAMGSSTLGGAFLGYLLILAGLHPLVLIPSIIIPPGLCIYDMLKQSTKESKKLATLDITLDKYQENVYYDDDAIKRFNYRIYRQILLHQKCK
jgi:hypothetical protein